MTHKELGIDLVVFDSYTSQLLVLINSQKLSTKLRTNSSIFVVNLLEFKI